MERKRSVAFPAPNDAMRETRKPGLFLPMDFDTDLQARPRDFARDESASGLRRDDRYLSDLIDVLSKNPRGLRRWSVMRAIRAKYEQAGQGVPQKFEDEIERTFRRHCAAAPGCAESSAGALFYRPQERAGEVWAVSPEHAAEFQNS